MRELDSWHTHPFGSLRRLAAALAAGSRFSTVQPWSLGKLGPGHIQIAFPCDHAEEAPTERDPWFLHPQTGNPHWITLYRACSYFFRLFERSSVFLCRSFLLYRDLPLVRVVHLGGRFPIAASHPRMCPMLPYGVDQPPNPRGAQAQFRSVGGTRNRPALLTPVRPSATRKRVARCGSPRALLAPLDLLLARILIRPWHFERSRAVRTNVVEATDARRQERPRRRLRRGSEAVLQAGRVDTSTTAGPGVQSAPGTCSVESCHRSP